jgi:succinoglycan biosynthesis transport protein ExoP
VIVDLPPIIPIVDVGATTHMIDAYVFVIQWGKTKIDVAEHALKSVSGVYDKLVGVVLNKVDVKKLSLFEGHSDYYDGYYGSYYAKYGDADQ